jgi:hypothetical protein
MKTKKMNRYYVELALASIETDVAARETLVNNVTKLAPKSPLWVDPALQKAVGDLATTFSSFKTTVATATASAKQHALDVAAQVAARDANDTALIRVRALTEMSAQSTADIESMAFTARTGRPPAPPLVPPATLDVVPGRKGSGKAKVAAHETGKTRRSYAAQSSPDPVGAGTWTPLPGAGKSRRLSGKSGTNVWVRFALMHGQEQSDWGVPVLVTLP